MKAKTNPRLTELRRQYSELVSRKGKKDVDAEILKFVMNDPAVRQAIATTIQDQVSGKYQKG